MLIRNWIFEILGEDFDNFERLSAKLRRRGEEHGVSTSEGEIRVVLEKLIRDGRSDKARKRKASTSAFRTRPGGPVSALETNH